MSHTTLSRFVRALAVRGRGVATIVSIVGLISVGAVALAARPVRAASSQRTMLATERLPATGGGTAVATIVLAVVLVATAAVCIGVPRRRPGERSSARRDP